jgi:alpha-glucoside transport system substrate-binding protein
MRIRSTLTAAATLGAVALLTTGCLSSGGSSGGGGGSSNTSNSIEIAFAFTGTQADNFVAVMNDWASKNNVQLKLTPTPSFESVITTRVQSNQLPDIAMFPQPGIMANLAKQGKLADLSSIVSSTDLGNFVQGALAVGKVNGKQYAFPYGINVKSTVYYPKSVEQQAGLANPPQTLADLQALTDKVAATGTTPWCLGIEAGSSTGWPMTDWVENLMLINYGPDIYNQWVQHQIPFNDPKVLDVLNQIQNLVLKDGNVNGGRGSIATNNFGTAGNPMFDNPPGCYMYRQGNFLTQKGFFPDAVVSNLDKSVGIFPMPGKTAGDKPVLGGGDLAGLFSQNNDAAKKALQYMASTDFGNALAKKGGYLSPRKDTDMTAYPDDTTRQFANIAYQSTTFAFDGSDQMPGAVGSGSFWKEMTAWVAGQEDAKKALDNIEASWPK